MNDLKVLLDHRLNRGCYPEQRESLLSWAALLAAEIPARHLAGPLLSSETPECRGTSRFGCCSSGKADRQSSKTMENTSWKKRLRTGGANREQSMERSRPWWCRVGAGAALCQIKVCYKTPVKQQLCTRQECHKQFWLCCGRRRRTKWSAGTSSSFTSQGFCAQLRLIRVCLSPVCPDVPQWLHTAIAPVHLYHFCINIIIKVSGLCSSYRLRDYLSHKHLIKVLSARPAWLTTHSSKAILIISPQILIQ